MSARAAICVDVENADEVRRAEDWLRAWREALSHISDDRGCGCCVSIWYVEGSREAIDLLPDDLTLFEGATDAYWASRDDDKSRDTTR